MAFVDGGDEGRLDRDRSCCMKVLGKFAFGVIMAENAGGLVWMGAF